MGALGLNGSNGGTPDPLASIVAELGKSVAFGEKTIAAGEGYETQVEHLQAVFASADALPEDYVGQIKQILAALSIANHDNHTASHVEVEGMPQSDSNMAFAELRAQLAEARSEGKLAEAIGRSDARHAEVVGRVDTGFAEIRGQISAVSARLEGIERTTGGIKTTVIITGLTAVALIVAVLTYGQAWFGIGITTRDAVKAEVAAIQQQTRSSAPTSP